MEFINGVCKYFGSYNDLEVAKQVTQEYRKQEMPFNTN